MECKLSKYLADFLETYNIQHAYLKIIKTWHSMLKKPIKLEQL